MARRRYISTEISTDPLVAKLGREHGYFAVLLYTWLIPHAEDDGTAPRDPEEILLKVLPGFRDLTTTDVESALQAMDELGLIKLNGERVYFPAKSFYKYQTYVGESKRRQEEGPSPVMAGKGGEQRKTPENADEQRGTPEKAASPSPSPSPLPSPSPSPTKTKNKKDMSGESAAGLSAEFEEWWEGYPRKDAKKEALAKYKATRRKGVSRDDLFRARDVYARYVRSQGTEKQFMLLGKTFLGPNERWRDWLRGPPVSGRSAEPATVADFADERREIDELFGGDQRAWWQWRKAGKPEIGEWRRGRGNGSARNGEGDRQVPG